MLLLEVALPWIEVIPLDVICISPKDLNNKKQSTNTCSKGSLRLLRYSLNYAVVTAGMKYFKLSKYSDKAATNFSSDSTPALNIFLHLGSDLG